MIIIIFITTTFYAMAYGSAVTLRRSANSAAADGDVAEAVGLFATADAGAIADAVGATIGSDRAAADGDVAALSMVFATADAGAEVRADRHTTAADGNRAAAGIRFAAANCRATINRGHVDGPSANGDVATSGTILTSATNTGAVRCRTRSIEVGVFRMRRDASPGNADRATLAIPPTSDGRATAFSGGRLYRSAVDDDGSAVYAIAGSNGGSIVSSNSRYRSAVDGDVARRR